MGLPFGRPRRVSPRAAVCSGGRGFPRAVFLARVGSPPEQKFVLGGRGSLGRFSLPGLGLPQSRSLFWGEGVP